MSGDLTVEYILLRTAVILTPNTPCNQFWPRTVEFILTLY